MRSTILHTYALCTFPKSEALQHARAQCTTTFQVMHHRRALVELYQCTKFRVTPPTFPEVKMPLYICAMCMCNVHSARAIHVHCATHHQMQCTIELRTLNSINVPNLVSLAQNFLEPEGPSRMKFFGPGARSLHPTRTAIRKAYIFGQYTCDLQVWDRWCTSFCLQGRQKNKRCKTLARALHVHTALQPIKSYGAKYTMPRSTHLPSLVSLAKNFLGLEDPTSKKFFDPGACSLHRIGTATTKAHTLGLYTCDLQIWGRWGLPFALHGWLKVCASLHAAARTTCVVHPRKVHNHASAGWVFPP